MTYEEKVLRRIPLEILLIAALIALLALFFFTPLTSLFILAGGLLSAASFVWLKTALNRFLGPDRRRAVRSGLVFYLLRLFLLLAVFSIIILLFPRMILAFVAGFSSLILAFLIEAALAVSQMKKWKV
ncbi:MAG TPA: ATP synthase subunit I [Candidatus Desulfaltia sp.]|nr:ATP synthase subunit I [Candidatus Desulfaltia sp.]